METWKLSWEYWEVFKMYRSGVKGKDIILIKFKCKFKEFSLRRTHSPYCYSSHYSRVSNKRVSFLLKFHECCNVFSECLGYNSKSLVENTIMWERTSSKVCYKCELGQFLILWNVSSSVFQDHGKWKIYLVEIYEYTLSSITPIDDRAT